MPIHVGMQILAQSMRMLIFRLGDCRPPARSSTLSLGRNISRPKTLRHYTGPGVKKHGINKFICSTRRLSLYNCTVQ